jgi:hypothetical protein
VRAASAHAFTIACPAQLFHEDEDIQSRVGLDRGEANSAAHTLRQAITRLHAADTMVTQQPSQRNRINVHGLPNAEKQASYRKRHLGKNGEKNTRCSFSTPLPERSIGWHLAKVIQ